jgi:hypothetical protein
MSPEERSERGRRAGHGARVAALRRRCEAAHEHMTPGERESLARILAPEAFRE